MFIDRSGSGRYKATRKGYDEIIDAHPQPADLQRIMRLFAHAHPSYSVAESATLLGLAETEISRELGEGSITALQFGGETRIAWTDLVWLGLLHRWTFRMLTVALHGRRAV